MSPTFSLEALLTRLESGTLTIEAAERSIAAQHQLYARPSLEDNYEAFLDWEERSQELASVLTRLVTRLLTEDDPEAVSAKGLVMMAAARLLGATAEGQVAFATGFRLVKLRQYLKALEPLERAEELLLNNEPLLGVSAASFRLDCLIQTQQYEEAVNYAGSLLQVARNRGFKGIEAVTLRDLGTSQSNLGRHSQANANLVEALAIRKQLSPQTCEEQSVNSEASFHRAIALAARAGGDYESALNAFEQAREIYLQEGNRPQAAYMLSEVGILWNLVGEDERARRYLDAAVHEAAGLGMTEEVQRWNGNLETSAENGSIVSPWTLLAHAAGLLRNHPPEIARARKLALECIQEAKARDERRLEVEARNVLAVTYSMEDKLFQALPAMQAALQSAAGLEDVYLEIRLRTNIGNMLSRLGRYQEAEEHYRYALDIGRSGRELSSSSEIRQAIGVTLARTAEQLALLLVGSWKKQDGSLTESRPAEVLTLGQGIRAVNLVKWLVAEQEVETSKSGDLKEKLLDLRAADVRLEMAAFTREPGLRSLVEAQGQAYLQFEAAMRQQGREKILDAPVVPVEEISQLLETGECLIDLLSISEGIVITHVGEDGRARAVFSPWERAELIAFLERWASYVARSSQTVQSGPTPSQISEEVHTALFAELQDRLIQRIAELFSKEQPPKRVFIVPHRGLFQLPFWGLSDFIPDISISILPATNALGLLRARPRRVVGQRLALGDVTSTLKYAQSEIDELPNFDLLTPSVDHFLSAVNGASLLHFAGHGTFNAQHPYLSGIVVEANATGPDAFGAHTIFSEGLLTVAHVFARMHIPKCFLTILSACSTGIPRNHPASEFTGMPTAFLVAGARNVIASLWPINDGFARLLMQVFYEFFLSGEEIRNAPSTALALARQTVCRMPREEVVRRLGSDQGIPKADPPYKAPVYTMAFEHFGVD